MSPHDHRESVPDELILANVIEGCADCFALLFHRYHRQCFAIAYRMVRDRAESEDLVQEVFLAILTQKERFDPVKGSIKTWILQFAYFKSMLRRRYLRVRHFYKNAELNEEQDVRRSDDVDRHGMNRAEWARFVSSGISVLNAKQQRTIKLVLLEGYTLQETADIQRETLANTRNNYYRGLRNMKSFLDTNVEKGHAVKHEDLVEQHGALGFQS